MKDRTNSAVSQVIVPLRPNGWKSLDTVEASNIDWLWPNRFVAGAINLIAGMGDVGKDVFCCGIVACCTAKVDWPDGQAAPPPMNVGLICPEDAAHHTIKPRMMAAGADTRRVRIWTLQKRPSTADLSSIDLLVVSPLIDLMNGHHDMNRERDVREFLLEWQSSQKTIIGTAHYGKATDRAAVMKVLGAVGMTNFIRSNWAIQRDDEDPEVRNFMRLKANLSPDSITGLAFTIEHVGPYDQSIRCRWEGSTDKRPDDDRVGPRMSAGKWLVAELAAAPNRTLAYKDILLMGLMEGFNEEQLKKAKSRNKLITHDRACFGGPVTWTLT